MDGAVARLILESLDRDDPKGNMSSIFQNYIDSLNKSQEELVAVGSEEDQEFARKIKFLRECEDNKDLGWFDYDSWNSFPRPFQDNFIKNMDHFFYGGVFFQYSKLLEQEGNIWKYISPGNLVTVLHDCGNNYHIVCFGENDTKYDSLGEHALMNLKKDFKLRTLRSIAKNSAGQIICRVKGSNDD